MPMFYTPKPRQFHYKPRFYDPDKEDWEAIKKKYGYSEDKKAAASNGTPSVSNPPVDTLQQDKDEAELIAHLEARQRQLEQKDKRERSKFTWKDLVRKREMPTFNYQPRFTTDTTDNAPAKTQAANGQKRRIARRFDIEDSKYFEPVSGTKIMFYVLLACLLLFWIFKGSL